MEVQGFITLKWTVRNIKKNRTLSASGGSLYAVAGSHTSILAKHHRLVASGWGYAVTGPAKQPLHTLLVLVYTPNSQWWCI